MKRQNIYLIEIGPVACKSPHDEGITFRVQTPARDRQHAIDRVRRYMAGRVTGCRRLQPVSVDIEEVA